MDRDTEEAGLVIPLGKLSPQALDSLIEEFILREGTDYGARVFSTEEKKLHIHSQLKAGKVVVVYDSASQACSLLKKENPALKALLKDT